MMHGDIEMIVRDLTKAGEVDDVQAAAFAGVVSGMSEADQRALLGVLMGVYDAWGQAVSDLQELVSDPDSIYASVVREHAGVAS